MDQQNLRVPAAVVPDNESDTFADQAVRVMQALGVKAVREPFGIRGQENTDNWFVTLVDIGRYLLIVRDVTHQQFVVLPRRSLQEVRRTLDNLGFDAEGYPTQERAEAVVDLKRSTWERVK